MFLTTESVVPYYIKDWRSSPNFDTVIQCSDGECKAHRLVLCYVSPYMGSLLDDQFPGEETVYTIPDVSQETMDQLLELAYTGTVTVINEKRLDVLHAAMKFLGWVKLEKLELVASSPRAAADVPKGQTNQSELFCLNGKETEPTKKDVTNYDNGHIVTATKNKRKHNSSDSNEQDDGEGVDQVLTKIDCLRWNGANSGSISEAEAQKSMEDATDIGGTNEEVTREKRNSRSDQNGNKYNPDSPDVAIESPARLDLTVQNIEDMNSDSESKDECRKEPDTASISPALKSKRGRKRKTVELADYSSSVVSVSKRKSLRIKEASSKTPTEGQFAVNNLHSKSNSSGNDSLEMVSPGRQPSTPRHNKEDTRTRSGQKEPVSDSKSETTRTPAKAFQRASHLVDDDAEAVRKLCFGNGSPRIRRAYSPSVGDSSLSHSDSETGSSLSCPNLNKAVKLNRTEWRKLTICTVCEKKARPAEVTNCLASHGFDRCWTCLEAMPLASIAQHFCILHKVSNSVERAECKWCGAQGDYAWLPGHVYSHGP